MRTTSITLASGLAAAIALALCGPAAAQLARNSNAPVDITADELEVIQNQCQAIWRGSAEALQETSRLRADVLRIFTKSGAAKAGSTNASCGEVERMEAQGSVYYVTPQQRVRSNAATYLASSETITMTGDVVAAQGQNVIRGERMIINTKTGEGQMVGQTTGRNQQNRVRGVFYPKSDNNQPAQRR